MGNVSFPEANRTRLERCTVFSALKLQRRSLHHITGDDVIGATEGIINATMVSKATVYPVSILLSDAVVNSLNQGHCYKSCEIRIRQTDSYACFHKEFFAYADA
jgi:hypothetical protein